MQQPEASSCCVRDVQMHAESRAAFKVHARLTSRMSALPTTCRPQQQQQAIELASDVRVATQDSIRTFSHGILKSCMSTYCVVPALSVLVAAPVMHACSERAGALHAF